MKDTFGSILDMVGRSQDAVYLQADDSNAKISISPVYKRPRLMARDYHPGNIRGHWMGHANLEPWSMAFRWTQDTFALWGVKNDLSEGAFRLSTKLSELDASPFCAIRYDVDSKFITLFWQNASWCNIYGGCDSYYWFNSCRPASCRLAHQMTCNFGEFVRILKDNPYVCDEDFDL